MALRARERFPENASQHVMAIARLRSLWNSGSDRDIFDDSTDEDQDEDEDEVV